jgi:hypothetical protein
VRFLGFTVDRPLFAVKVKQADRYTRIACVWLLQLQQLFVSSCSLPAGLLLLIWSSPCLFIFLIPPLGRWVIVKICSLFTLLWLFTLLQLFLLIPLSSLILSQMYVCVAPVSFPSTAASPQKMLITQFHEICSRRCKFFATHTHTHDWTCFQLMEGFVDKLMQTYWGKFKAKCRSQWPRCLRQVLSSAARTLGSQDRILLGAWMCVCVSVYLCCPV